MDKVEIVQKLLDATGGGTYLEIGVWFGDSLLPINADRKIGIDSNKLALFATKLRGIRRGQKNCLYATKSDNFFKKYNHIFKEQGVDVAFVDGLHTHTQSLRDVNNCLTYLNQNGYVVLHDCNPTTFAMAYPAGSFEEVARIKPHGWTGEWCGDVWKTIVNLRATRPDLEVCVLDCDYGVGIVKKGEPESTLDRVILSELGSMQYNHLEQNRTTLLNLKHPSYLEAILKRRYG